MTTLLSRRTQRTVVERIRRRVGAWAALSLGATTDGFFFMSAILHYTARRDGETGAPPVQHGSVPSSQIHRSSAALLTSLALTGLSTMYWIFTIKPSSLRRALSNDSSCQTRPARPNSLLIRCAETLLISCMISGMLKVPRSSHLGVRAR